jgi:hypothetical protein
MSFDPQYTGMAPAAKAFGSFSVKYIGTSPFSAIGLAPKIAKHDLSNTRQFVTIYRVHLRAVRFLPVSDVCAFRPPHDSIVKAQASPTQPAVLGPP